MKRKWHGLIVLALAATSPAWAQDEGDKKAAKGDAPAARREGERERGDGQRPEGRPDGGRRYEGDGPGRPPFGPPAIIRALDSDADGEISAEEIKNASASLAKLDRNSDGKLTREELMPGMAGRPGEGGPQVAEFARRMKEADTNGDGKLSKEEAPERMRENFDRVDTNSDGYVDEAEVRQMFERMRANFGGERRPDGDRPRGDRPRDGERREGDRPRDGERREGDRPRDGDKGDRPREGDRPRGDRE